MVDDIILYEASQVGFDKIGSTSSDPDERLGLGIGVLFDAISCEVYEELNGEFELEMTYPIAGQLYSEIQNGRIIVAKPNPYVRPQPFRIYNITKPIDGIVTVKGQHITYDMAGMIIYPYEEDAKDGVGHVYRYKTKTAHLQDIRDGGVVTEPGVVRILNFNVNPAYDPDGENPFRIVLGPGWSPNPEDPSETCEFNLEDPTNLRGLMGGSDSGLVKMFKGYWTFDCYTCTFSKTRGSDRGVTFEYGRDITDLEVEDSMGLPYTHVLPYYKNGSDYVYYDGGSGIGDAEESMLIPIEEVSRPHKRILELDLTEEVKYKIDHTPDLTASFQWENLTKYNVLVLYGSAGSSNEGKTRILRRSRSIGTWPNGFYRCERLSMITMPKLNARPANGRSRNNPYYGEDFADMVRDYEGDAWNTILWAMPVGSCVYIKRNAVITYKYTASTNKFDKETIEASGIYMKMEGTAANVIATYPENGAKNTWRLVTTHGNQLTFDDTADDPFKARKMDTDDGPQIITDLENPSYDELRNNPTARHNWMLAIFSLLIRNGFSSAVGGSAWFFAYQGPESSSDLDLVQQALKETADEYITKNHVGGIKTDLRISFYEADGINNYHIELGDTVYISHPNLVGDTMSVTVTRYRYDVIMGRYSELEIGDPNQDSTLSNDISGLGSFYENTTTKKQLASALTRSMKTVNGAIGGCVKIVNSQTDAPDNPDQILIMDKPTVASSTYMWRWNYGGLMAGQKDANGIWRYGLAMTIDGRIVADRIKVGTLSGINMQFEGEDEYRRPHRFIVNGENGKVTLINVDLVAYGASGVDPIFQLGSDGTAMMHGDLLVSGTIKADKIMDRNGELYGGIPQSKLSYDAIHSDNYSYMSGVFSVAGSSFDLQNGVIRSKNFAIDESGNAYFKGNVMATSGTIGGCDISGGVLKVNATNINQVTVGTSIGRVFADLKSDGPIPYVKITAKDASNNVIFQLDTTQTGTDMLKVAAANITGQLNANSILVKDTSDNVIFSANSADHTVRISGAHIDAGTIKADKIMDRNGNLYGGIPQSKLSYDAIHSDNYSYTSGTYAASGSMFDLQNGVIRSKNFAIDASGNAYFNGNVTATSGTIGGCAISGGVLKVGAANVNQVTVGSASGRVFADLKGDGTTPYVKITAKDASNNIIFQLDTTQTGTNMLKVAAANITGQLNANSILVKDTSDNVIFSANSADHTVSINGAHIDAGTVTRLQVADDLVKSTNYVGPVAPSKFSQAGTYLNLANGSIFSPHFAIDTSGNAYFEGNVTATAGTIGGCNISNGVLKVGSANVNQVTVGSASGRVFADLKGDGTTPYVKITAKDASNNIIFQLDTTQTGTNMLKVAAANITGQLNANSILVKDTSDNVIFSANAADHTVRISGAHIDVGTIKADKIMDRNGNLYGGIPQSKLSYDAIHSDNYSYTSGTYATSGSSFDLQNGVIRSKNFAIDASGNAYFKGNVTATAGTIGGCAISGGVLKVGAANVDQVTVGSASGRVFADLKGDGTTPYVKITAKDASNNVIFQLDTTQTGTDMLKVAAANITGQLNANSILVKDTSDNVIFSANSADHTVSINGAHIDAGTVTRLQVADDLVKSTNYVGPVAPSRFSQAGTYINLADGSIFSPHFAIDASGNAYFEGNVTATAGTIGGCAISNGVLKVGAANVNQVTVGSASGRVFADLKGDGTTPYVKITAKDASNNIIFQLDTTQTGTDMLKVAAANITGQLNANSILVKDTSDNVIFSANATDHMVSISGAHIDVGTIKADKIMDRNGNLYGGIPQSKLSYDAIHSDNYSYTSGTYATSGSSFDLQNGVIRSKNFAIDASGNAYFKGNVTATAGTIGGCTISGGVLKVNAANVNQVTVGSASGRVFADLKANGTTPYVKITAKDASNNVLFQLDTTQTGTNMLKVAAANITGTLTASQINTSGLVVQNLLVKDASDRVIIKTDTTGTTPVAQIFIRGTIAGQEATIFSADSQQGTVSINGQAIDAGTVTRLKLADDAIQSTNYQAGAIFSLAGTAMNLATGVFQSPHFAIDANGDAYFNGNIESISGNTTIFKATPTSAVLAGFTADALPSSVKCLRTNNSLTMTSAQSTTSSGVYVGTDGIRLLGHTGGLNPVYYDTKIGIYETSIESSVDIGRYNKILFNTLTDEVANNWNGNQSGSLFRMWYGTGDATFLKLYSGSEYSTGDIDARLQVDYNGNIQSHPLSTAASMLNVRALSHGMLNGYSMKLEDGGGTAEFNGPHLTLAGRESNIYGIIVESIYETKQSPRGIEFLNNTSNASTLKNVTIPTGVNVYTPTVTDIGYMVSSYNCGVSDNVVWDGVAGKFYIKTALQAQGTVTYIPKPTGYSSCMALKTRTSTSIREVELSGRLYVTGTIVGSSSGQISSDRNVKNSIAPIEGSEYDSVLDNLVPVSFKYDDGTSGRTHFGFIAQDIAELVENAGLSVDEFAPICIDAKGTEEERYSLRYQELIAFAFHEINKLKKEIQTLKGD